MLADGNSGVQIGLRHLFNEDEMSDTHLGGYITNGDPNTFTPDIWGWLLVEYGIQSVLDIGCGTAVNLAWFDSMNCATLGIEGHSEAIAIAKTNCKHIITHDYTRGPLELVGRTFDLGLCTEFVEHVDAQYVDNFMATMKSCDIVLLSHAVPGQGGYHHVNEQPPAYWIDVFKKYGFAHVSQASKKFRKTLHRKPSAWGRSTLMLFGQLKHYW